MRPNYDNRNAQVNVSFSPIDEGYIKTKIAEGYYGDAAELVRDAVRRLRELDDDKHARLMEALDRGDKAIQEGRTTTYTPKLLDKIARTVKQQKAGNTKTGRDDRR